MRKIAGFGIVASVVFCLAAGDAFARGGGGRGGGQQGMRGRSTTSLHGYGGQAGAMQRQMMQNRYRMMQSGFGNPNNLMQQSRLRDGSCTGQQGFGGWGGSMQWQGTQNFQGSRQSGFGNQSGLMQQQRLRDGSCGGQAGNGGTMQMMQNRLRNGQSPR